MSVQEKERERMRSVPTTFFHRWRRREQKKIRIGYLSPYFCNHEMLRFLYAFLAIYNKARFEVFAYMSGCGDGVSCHLMDLVEGWRDVSRCSPSEAARVIYEDRIDILVDLSGHTEGSCLPILACRPAPVQICGIGYFASTGLSTVDYFLGDSFLDDAETAQEFTEELLLLPQSHFCYVPFHGNVPVGEAPFLKNGYVTFGSFNNFTKASDELLGGWARILEAVPHSRLLLKAEVFNHADSRRLSLDRIRRAGIDLSRVEVRGVTRAYLPEYRDMDIALDTFPYPGGGTTCDALYMGVPVVSLKGRSHGERFGWSILRNMGLEELCTASPEEYVARAVMLASDGEMISILRRNLRSIMERSPLMDCKGYMKALEQGYERIWEKFLAEQKPPSMRDAVRLVPVMDKLLKAREKEQALAVADEILAARPLSRDIGEKLAALYLDEKETEHAAGAVGLLPQDYPLGQFLRAKLLFLQENLAGSEKLCLTIAENGGLPSPWGGVEQQLLAEIYKREGEMEKAARAYLAASRDKNSVSLGNRMAQYGNYLLMLHFLPHSGEFIYRESCRAEEYVRDVPVFSHVHRKTHQKLRIGYLSPDFRRHVVACFSQAFFQAADHGSFQVYGYATCPGDDVSRRLSDAADGWRNLRGLAPEKAARIIYEDEIDILVHLAGHTGDSSLQIMAHRPAPIQVCGIGYFSTTGLSCMDYFLVDRYTAPAGEEVFFTEQLLRLPHSHFCYKQVVEVPEVQEHLPSEENGYITFGSMNNVNKVSNETLEAWGRIMSALPDAKLYLKHGMLDRPARREKELERLASVGIEASRVIMEGFSVDYLGEYHRMDIALDTFPYPGGGTTCDALYMGVPVITLAGNSNHERFGLSILSNLGMEELCGRTAEEYVARAVALAQDRELLCLLHRELRGIMEKSPVMHSRGYMKDLERSYEEIWARYEKDGNDGRKRENHVVSRIEER